MTKPWTIWLIIASAVLGFAAVTQRMTAVMVPDSSSYLDYPFDSLDAMMRDIRTPGYPVLLRLIMGTIGASAIPIVQMLIHATAAWLMSCELIRWGMSGRTSLAAGLAIALSATAMDNEAIVSTDLVAASFGVMATSNLLACIRAGFALRPSVGVIVCVVMAIAIRPASLSLVGFIPIAGVMLVLCKRQTNQEGSLRQSIFGLIRIVAPIMLVIAGWIVLRGVTVGDFSFLPFGHQNLAGITTQLTTGDEQRIAAPQSTTLLDEIAAARVRYADEGRQLPIGAPGATMTIESRWDEIVWRIVVPAVRRMHPDDAIAQHRELANLNRQILAAYPWRYVRWIVLAMRRACWGTAANIVMHPIFLTAIMVWIAYRCVQLVNNPRIPHETIIAMDHAGLDALFLIAVTYFFINVGFVVLTSPPLGRFADATAIFIPAWIAARALSVTPLRSRSDCHPR